MDIQSLVKKAQEMQNKVKEAQAKLAEMEFEGKASGGLVGAVVNGKKEVLRVSIDESVYGEGDKEMLEDLVVAAVNNAISEADDQATKLMEDATQGMPVPEGING